MWTKSYGVTTQIKPLQQYFHMVLLFLRSLQKKLECFWIFLQCPLLKVKRLKIRLFFWIGMKRCHYKNHSSHIQEFFQKKKERKKKRARTYICFVPDHLKIEFIWISVQCLRQFKKQTEVIISCKLIICNILKTIEIQSRQSKPFKHLRGRLLDRPSVDKVQQM